jgi:hypothetical protein
MMQPYLLLGGRRSLPASRLTSVIRSSLRHPTAGQVTASRCTVASRPSFGNQVDRAQGDGPLRAAGAKFGSGLNRRLEQIPRLAHTVDCAKTLKTTIDGDIARVGGELQDAFALVILDTNVTAILAHLVLTILDQRQLVRWIEHLDLPFG